MQTNKSPSELATAEDVRHAYRLLLGREPDAAGYATHVKQAAGRIRATDLARVIMSSDEYRHAQLNRDVVEVPLDGFVLIVSAQDSEVSASIRQHKAYEPYVESVLRRTLRRGDTFVDVGANIGYFTALASHLVGPSGHVAAWEPLDKNVQIIYATLWKNQFGNVTVYPFAASSDVQLVTMVSSPTSSNAGIGKSEFGGARTRVLAQTQRLDDQLKSLTRLDVIKFDIEGHEIHAWRGARSLLAKHRPHVLTEFHPRCIRSNTNFQPEEYLRELLDYGGNIEVLHRTRPNVICDSIEALMGEWKKADDEFAMNGGMHIDLYINPFRGNQ